MTENGRNRNDGPQEGEGAVPRARNFSSLKQFYRRLAAQRTIVVLVLVAAAGIQYYLVNTPVADLGETAKFSPAKVKAADQVVEFTDPDTGGGRFSFKYDEPAESQKQRMLVDGYFEEASLSEETVQRLATLGVQAPSQPASISYSTSAAHNGTCSTTFQVQIAGDVAATRTVQFFQSEVAPSDRHRLLEVKIAGPDSVATLSSGGSFSANGLSQCQVSLHVGEWQQLTAAFVPIKVRISAGSTFRFRWEAADIQPSGWSTSGPLLPLLEFGDTPKRSFRAGDIKVVPSQAADSSSANSGLVAHSERKDVPLTIESFSVGTDELQFVAAGRGHVLEDGKVITTANPIEAINKYPLPAAMFAAANLGLLNWARRRFSPRRHAEQKSVVRFLKGRPPGADSKARGKAAS